MKTLPVLSSMSLESAVSQGLICNSQKLSSASSVTYISANRAIYIPFTLSEPVVVTQLFAYNGATVSGNIDLGIYDRAGTRLVSSGLTAQSGTSALQLFNIADTELGAGRFFLAVTMDNTTGTLYRIAIIQQSAMACGMCQQALAASPNNFLPATATFAALSSTYLPIIGFMTGATI